MTPAAKYDEAAVLGLLREKYGRVSRPNNGWAMIPCPTCDSHHRRKMKRAVRLDTLRSICFICETWIAPRDLVQGVKLSDLPAGGPSRELPKEEHPLARQMPGRRFIPVDQLPADHPAVRFLAADHLFDLAIYARDFGIVWCPAEAGVILARKPFTTSGERLIFPVRFKGELAGWQARSIPGTFYGDMPDIRKYVHLFEKGQVLYNYDQARNHGMVVLVEGVKKALKLPCCVASFGKNVSVRQLELLAEWPRVVVALDAGPEARAESEKVVEALRWRNIETYDLDPGRFGRPSPDEMTSAEFAMAVCVVSNLSPCHNPPPS